MQKNYKTYEEEKAARDAARKAKEIHESTRRGLFADLNIINKRTYMAKNRSYQEYQNALAEAADIKIKIEKLDRDFYTK